MEIAQTWKLATRVNYYMQPIFKMKHINQNQIITNLPKQGRVQTLDCQLRNLSITHQFSTDIQAIEQFDMPTPHIAAGTKNGTIEVKNIQEGTTYSLCPQVPASPHLYINDMVYLGNGRLANCHNNGYLATWNLTDISNQLSPLSYSQIHQSFTYKIRSMGTNSVLTCSNDNSVCLYNYQRNRVRQRFHHQNGVWCAYPLNDSIFCSAGLMNRIVFWDIRQHRIIQKCELDYGETSFVTRLDDNSIIFGDESELCTCDLRKVSKRTLDGNKMKVSAESIVVLGGQVIVAGRGGDLCRFIKTSEVVETQQQKVGFPEISQNMLGMFTNLQDLIMHLRGQIPPQQQFQLDQPLNLEQLQYLQEQQDEQDPMESDEQDPMESDEDYDSDGDMQ